MEVLEKNRGLLGLSGLSAKSLLGFDELEEPVSKLTDKGYIDCYILDGGDCIKTKIYKLTKRGRNILKVEGEK